MTFFEDIAVGDEADLGSYTFTEAEIVDFARQWDPQPFHIDSQAGVEGPFGALCASGWHTACVWMKLFVAHNSRMIAEREKAGEPVPRIGASPGFTDLSWRKPVYPGDTLTYSTRVVDKRELSSRPDWGLITLRNEAENQTGEPVFGFTAQVFVERRSSAAG